MTPWTTAHQASLPITNSKSLLKIMSIESEMPSDHLILYHPLPLPLSISPSIRIFSNDQLFASGSQSIGASASTSGLPVNIQDGFPLGLTGLISLQSKGLSRIFSSITDTLLYIKQITNKDLLYGTGNSIQYSVVIYMGKESKSE